MTVLNLNPDITTSASSSYAMLIVIKRRPSNSRWQSCTWQVSEVIVNSQDAASDWQGLQIRSGGEGYDDFLWGGLQLNLHKDECESYYHNLLSPNPSLFIVTRNNDQNQPEPFIITASFDEAHAYLEADDSAHAVPIPPELYPAIEHFVINHYKPEQKKRRQRKNWKQS